MTESIIIIRVSRMVGAFLLLLLLVLLMLLLKDGRKEGRKEGRMQRGSILIFRTYYRFFKAVVSRQNGLANC
jgi:hypothetical protein